jgi:transposase
VRAYACVATVEVQDALSDLLGVRICLGSISNREAEVAQALEAPVAQVGQAIREAQSAHADETGWFEGKVTGRAKRAWLWGVATAHLALFRISLSRGSEVAKDLLGKDFTGLLTTDRWSGYIWYDTFLRQLCWSHSSGGVGRIGGIEAMLRAKIGAEGRGGPRTGAD